MIEPREGLEDALAMLRGDAGATIRDGQFDDGGVAIEMNIDRLSGGVAGGVVEDVADGGAEEIDVAVDPEAVEAGNCELAGGFGRNFIQNISQASQPGGAGEVIAAAGKMEQSGDEFFEALGVVGK